MKTAIVIPARYASSRLPAKPLLRETGKYLIQHVYERACESSADIAVVATDDRRIFDAVQSFGGHVVMTRVDHASGTDRVAEVAAGLDADVIVNLQGDEPLIEPETLDLLPGLLARDTQADVATLAVPIASVEQWRDPNCVKVVRDAHGPGRSAWRRPAVSAKITGAAGAGGVGTSGSRGVSEPPSRGSPIGQAHLRHRRRGQFPGQGSDLRLDRHAPGAPRPARPAAE